MDRKLSLRTERLAELTPDELAGVVGGLTLGLTCFTVNPLLCTRQTLTACPDFYCTGTC